MIGPMQQTRYGQPSILDMILSEVGRSGRGRSSAPPWNQQELELLHGRHLWNDEVSDALAISLRKRGLQVEIERGLALVSAALPSPDEVTPQLVATHGYSTFPGRILQMRRRWPRRRDSSGVTIFDATVYCSTPFNDAELFGLCDAFLVDRPDVRDPALFDNLDHLPEPFFARNVRSTIGRAERVASKIARLREPWDLHIAFMMRRQKERDDRKIEAELQDIAIDLQYFCI